MAPTRKHCRRDRKIIYNNGLTQLKRSPLKLNRTNILEENCSSFSWPNLKTKTDDYQQQGPSRPPPAFVGPVDIGTCSNDSTEYQWRKIKKETGWEKVRENFYKAHSKGQFLEEIPGKQGKTKESCRTVAAWTVAGVNYCACTVQQKPTADEIFFMFWKFGRYV